MIDFHTILEGLRGVFTSKIVISFLVGAASSLFIEILSKRMRTPSIRLANRISLCNYHRFAIKAGNDSWFKELYNVHMSIILVREYLGRTTHERIAKVDNIEVLDKRFMCRYDRFIYQEIDLSDEQMSAMCKGAFLHVILEGETKRGDKNIVEKCFHLSKDVKAYAYKNNGLEFNADMDEGSPEYIMRYARCIGEKFYTMNT